MLSYWRVISICAMVPTIVAVSSYLVLAGRNDEGHSDPIYVVDVDDSGALPHGTRFIELKSVMQTDYVVKVTRGYRTFTTHSFAPLTSNRWTKDQPIRFIIDTTVDEQGRFVDEPIEAETRTRRPVTPKNQIENAFQGKLVKDALPSSMLREFARRGLNISKPHFVLERMHFFDGKIPDAARRNHYAIIWQLGAAASILIFLGGWLGKVLGHLRHRKL